MRKSLKALTAEAERLRREYPETCERYAREKWIRVMCDYSAEGVWAKGGGGTSPHYLPISIPLIARILHWQYVFETLGIGLRPVNRRPLIRWAKEGLAIAIEMKRQLPDWTVIYHDERREPPFVANVSIEAAFAHFRPWFEYEITDEVLRTGLPPDNHPGDFPRP